jgi:hypothetical protein
MSHSRRKHRSRGNLPYLAKGTGELAVSETLSGGPGLRSAKRNRVREILNEAVNDWNRRLGGGPGLAGATA